MGKLAGKGQTIGLAHGLHSGRCGLAQVFHLKRQV